ncbi:hypothetical protein Aperf_G00000057504 [Anoplocephala perfoliata]
MSHIYENREYPQFLLEVCCVVNEGSLRCALNHVKTLTGCQGKEIMATSALSSGTIKLIDRQRKSSCTPQWVSLEFDISSRLYSSHWTHYRRSSNNESSECILSGFKTERVAILSTLGACFVKRFLNAAVRFDAKEGQNGGSSVKNGACLIH